ncbi:MAG: NAD(+) synthase [Pirellulaceae bacterium]|nr:NAD(+) synthase [Pirellulaceae bacterium]
MKLIKVGAAVLNQTPLDWDGNRDRILSAIQQARDEHVSVLCLPELCITGYGCEDAFHSVGLQETAQQILLEIIPETQGMIVSLGLPLFHRGGLFNTAGLVANGKLLGFVGKQNLAGEGLHYEPRWFKPWPAHTVVETDVGQQSLPLGDLIFECGQIRIGFEICEDAWVANRPGGQLATQGVDMLLNPSASHFAFGKHLVRRRFILDGSRAYSVAYIYANLLGNEAGRAIYDGDAMIASCGKMLATGPRFSFEDSYVTSALVDVDAVRVNRARTASYQPSMERTPQLVEADFSFPLQEVEPAEISRTSWESSETIKEEEFARAISLGLFDYLRKSRSRGFIVSLSGGADSAAVATLCFLMVHFAHQKLGGKKLREKLNYIAGLAETDDAGQMVHKLLTTAYQATQNSSRTTQAAAAGLANALKANHLELDVEEIVQGYTGMIERAVQRPLTWDKDDLTLQNIQARARGPSVWMLANLREALLLATSNRSEAAVGYATMDGDTCGGLSPIAGIDKAFLRQWLVWMQQQGPVDLAPLPILSLVNDQEPTAELRPLAQGQTDEADLMPYDLLDAIERAAIRDKQTPTEVLQQIQINFSHYEDQQLADWIERFFRLWCRNQWKRERYAPSFHVDDENLDPKTWCRFPILNGGFERELREMRRSLSQSKKKPAKDSSA